MKKWPLFALCLVAAGAAGYRVRALGDNPAITSANIEQAEKVMGLEFTPAERESLLDDTIFDLECYRTLRSVTIDNSVAPALVFQPILPGSALRAQISDEGHTPIVLSPPAHTKAPQKFEELAFYSVRDLGELLRTRKISSLALTQMYIARLQKYGPELECVITLTEDRALESARRADAEIASGKYRGPLHGIPYGAKDLLAVKGYPTTWGAMPFKDQTIDDTATVIRKLDDAGAVLVAKLTLGALAWGDVWYGGMTRNPWNLEEGSSGSSAGSASATSAGLVAFAIGTETWGSIVSPSTRCGTTGLRPTFGRVSRSGAMALSWSMDKIGPICRTVEDCAIVLDAIRGSDGKDASVVDMPFAYDATKPARGMRVGYIASAFAEEYAESTLDNAVLTTLRSIGVELVPIELPDLPVSSLGFILSAEAAAAFDDFTRDNRDDLMVRQIKNAWPTTFRAARFIPAVEYIQANRVRTMLMQQMETLGVDVWVAPSFVGDNLLLTNLTGHPCVVLPDGFKDDGSPTSITFMGKLFGEADVLTVARAYQNATDFHTRHPDRYAAK